MRPSQTAHTAPAEGHTGEGRRRGFTLVELLITLAIMAIIVTLGLPNLLTILARSELTQTGRQVEILLQKSRREAIKREFPVLVEADGRVVQGFVDENANGSREAAEEVLGTVNIPGRVSWNGTPVDFAFLPNGSASTLGNYGFRNEDGDSLQVRLTSLATSNVEFVKSW